MSLPPVTIPELDPAGAVDPLNDLMLIRQGLTDRKITVENLTRPSFNNVTDLPDAILASDVILIGRNNGGGSYTTYRTLATNLGFLINTVSWFYQNIPNGWQVLAGTGDRLIATRNQQQVGEYGQLGLRGTWQQPDHILSINEIPSHRHRVSVYGDGANIGETYAPQARRLNANTLGTPFTAYEGGGAAHNHGDTYRPAAAVGRICIKVS